MYGIPTETRARRPPSKAHRIELARLGWDDRGDRRRQGRRHGGRPGVAERRQPAADDDHRPEREKGHGDEYRDARPRGGRGSLEAVGEGLPDGPESFDLGRPAPGDLRPGGLHLVPEADRRGAPAVREARLDEPPQPGLVHRRRPDRAEVVEPAQRHRSSPRWRRRTCSPGWWMTAAVPSRTARRHANPDHVAKRGLNPCAPAIGRWTGAGSWESRPVSCRCRAGSHRRRVDGDDDRRPRVAAGEGQREVAGEVPASTGQRMASAALE
jgi:hypothetical protein